MIPSQPLEALRYLGLVPLALVILAGLWVLLSARHNLSTTISHRLTTNRVQYVVMALALTFCGAIFYTFAYVWLGPTYHLPLAYYLTLIVSYIAQTILAWTPVSGKSARHTSLHTHGGEVVSCSMALCLLFLFIANHALLPVFSYWTTLVGLLFSLGCIMAYIFSRKAHEYIVVLESAYVAVFSTIIVLLIFKV